MLAARATPLEAAIVANFAAGVEVGKAGAATVSPDEILEAYDAH
jgi:D-beta-D-heptose 7-phosphate kinase/D-beta-D-heptose 1-phosphate adenosyltransferase